MRTALYRHFAADGTLLYVGVSKRPVRRLDEHSETARWFHQLVRTTVCWFDTREAALAAEKAAIQGEHPRFNIVHNARQRGVVRNIAPPVGTPPARPDKTHYSSEEVAALLGILHPRKFHQGRMPGFPEFEWIEDDYRRSGYPRDAVDRYKMENPEAALYGDFWRFAPGEHRPRHITDALALGHLKEVAPDLIAVTQPGRPGKALFQGDYLVFPYHEGDGWPMMWVVRPATALRAAA